MSRTIKVLVVDDSALIRQMLSRALSLDPRIEVVGIACNGVEAIERTMELRPDVVTLDIEMPELSGLEALPFLLKSSDARVLMLTSVEDPDVAYKALAAGAVDFITKPRGGFATSLTDLSEHLVKKIKTAYRVDPAKRFVTSGLDISAGSGDIDDGPAPRIRPGSLPTVVCIAASTGGPPALETVLAGLSPDLPAAYIIVQHLPAGFTTSLIRRLNKVTDLDVVEATDGALIEAGKVYFAPHGCHTTVQFASRGGCTLRLSDAPPVHGVRPAADPLMASAAEALGAGCVGVVLTGMGSDGAAGLEAIKVHGGRAIVQNEETSIVWGMPGAAVRRGAADQIAPLDAIAAHIRRAVREEVRVRG